MVWCAALEREVSQGIAMAVFFSAMLHMKWRGACVVLISQGLQPSWHSLSKQVMHDLICRIALVPSSDGSSSTAMADRQEQLILGSSTAFES